MTEAFDYNKLPTGPDGRKHCKTRDGQDVTLLCNDGPYDYPIVGRFDADGATFSRRKDGRYCTSIPSEYDLVMPKRRAGEDQN